MPSTHASLRTTLRAALLSAAPLWLAACSSPASAPSDQPIAVDRAPAAGQQTFGSPEQAVEALDRAVQQRDRTALASIFGPDLSALESGLPEVDDAHLQRFAAAMSQRRDVVPVAGLAGVKSLVTGVDETPFPVPIVQQAGRWFFDTPAGVAELLLRRIGANELRTMEVCRALVTAQREYFELDRDGDGVREYATKLVSSPGQRDGLHWSVDPAAAGSGGGDAALSPIGPKLALAASQPGSPPREPYHGYVYRSLTRQGAGAPGGAREFAPAGQVSEGFAFIAYPAIYGQTGVMTFMIGSDGVLYEFDLGPDSAAMAEAVQVYDPTGWLPAAPPPGSVGTP